MTILFALRGLFFFFLVPSPTHSFLPIIFFFKKLPTPPPSKRTHYSYSTEFKQWCADTKKL